MLNRILPFSVAVITRKWKFLRLCRTPAKITRIIQALYNDCTFSRAVSFITSICCTIRSQTRMHTISPVILRKKMAQLQIKCKRRYLNGFQRRNSSPITYQKSPKVLDRESGKKRNLLGLTSIQSQSSMETRLNKMSNSSAHKNPLT